MAKDWNDLHIEQGLDVVRTQLYAAAASAVPVQLEDLPRSPSLEEPAENGAIAPEGAGGAAGRRNGSSRALRWSRARRRSSTRSSG